MPPRPRPRDLNAPPDWKLTQAVPDPILNVRWPYTLPEHPALAEVAREISGQALADITDATGQSIKSGQQVPGFAWLKDDPRYGQLMSELGLAGITESQPRTQTVARLPRN